jgi:hypothetical protein
MNLEAIKARSKKEASQALNSFQWTPDQKLVLELIKAEGSFTGNFNLFNQLFGKIESVEHRDIFTQSELVLQWGVEFNNGRKLFRKKDISFMPLF